MITYYDDRSVQVTSTAIRVDGRTLPARRDQPWSGTGGAAAPGGCSPGGARSAPRWPGRWWPRVLGIGLAVWLHRSPTVTVAIVGASVLVGLAVGPVADFLFEHLDRSYARGSRQLEMWARWRGQPVRLLRTGDALRFGQIYRAVQRAMENAAPAAPTRPPPGPVSRSSGQHGRTAAPHRGPGTSGPPGRPPATTASPGHRRSDPPGV